MKPFATLATAGAISLLSLSANAGFYLGGMIGTSQPDSSLENISDSSLDSDAGLKIAAGYSFLGLVAVELAYVELGEFELNSRAQDEVSGTLATTIEDFGLAEGEELSGETSGLELAAMVKLPLTPIFDVYARAGIFAYDLDVSASNAASSSDLGAVYGLGLAFTKIPKITLKLEYTAYTAEFDRDDISRSLANSYKHDVDTSFVGVGLNYHF